MASSSFGILRQGGAFGPIEDMPESLRGSEIEFTFRSPVSDMADQNDAAVFVEGMSTILQPAAQIDPAQLENIDITESVRDSLRGLGWKSHWFKDKKAVEQKRDEMAARAHMQDGMGALNEIANIAELGGKGAKVASWASIF